MDGDDSTYWSTDTKLQSTLRNQDQKPWIQLNFETTYKIENIKIKTTTSAIYKVKDISLAFSQGANVEYELTNDQNWNEVALTNFPISKFVNITGKSGYGITTQYYGFSDIQVFGCVTGIPQV